MKFTSTLVALLWVAHASVAADSGEDTKKTQGYVRKPKYHEDELVDESPWSPERVLAVNPTPKEWLAAHNSYRKQHHEAAGKTYRALRWSSGLANLAQEWVDGLASNCKVKSYTGNYGVITQYNGVSAENTLEMWMNKLNQGYPTNGASTQVLWRPTKYVGCASAASTSCDMKACFYAKPGNCNMGQYQGNKWKTPTFADTSICAPTCPPEYTAIKNESGREVGCAKVQS